jgi:uncharacterized coiled-coil protein SlyX
LSTTDQYANMRVIQNTNSVIDKHMYIGYNSGATSNLHFYSNNTNVMSISGGNNVGITGNIAVSGTVDGRDVAADGTILDAISASTRTLTNKTIDSDNNTITNIVNADIKAAAAIDATKIADGTVTSTEFQYINTVTSNVQTQLDAKVSSSLYTASGSLAGATVVTQGANTLDFTTTAVDGFSVDGTTFSVDGSNNRVGIGTAAPSAQLHSIIAASGGDATNNAAIFESSTGNGIVNVRSSGSGNFAAYYGSLGTDLVGAIDFRPTTGDMSFWSNSAAGGTTWTERMRIENATGNVGIGTDAPAQKLDVNGNIAVSGTTVHTSDIRYKKNIKPLENSLNKVLKLQGVNYDWLVNEFPNKNFSDRQQIGVIAQEIEKILPDLVFTDDAGYKSVDYSHLTPVLIEAIKEQQQIIENLKNEVATQSSTSAQNKKELSSLKSELEAVKSYIYQESKK